MVDANRIFCELISGRRWLAKATRSDPEIRFFCPKYVLVELFKHKERIVAATRLDEGSMLDLLHKTLEQIHFFDESAIRIGNWAEAWRLVRDIDEKDVAYVALTFELDGELWTGDKALEAGLRRKGFTRFHSS